MTRLLPVVLVVVLSLGAVAPIDAQEQPAPVPAEPSIAKPKVKSMGMPFMHYPSRELHRNHTGYVYLEYSIDDHGRPKHCVVLETTAREFSDAACDAIGEFKYAVPADWSAIGGPAQRYKISVHFEISGYPTHEGHPGVEAVVIKVNRP